MNLLENISKQFEQYAAQAVTDNFFEQRKAAFSHFNQLGFPTIQHEEWKYTNLKNLVNGNYEFTCAPAEAATQLLEKSVAKSLIATRLVFINGAYYPNLSTILETDVIVTNLANARKTHTEQFEKHFGKYAKTETEALNALNTALLSDGAFVYVEKNKTTKHPIIIINISDSSEVNVWSQPRNLVVLEDNSNAIILESFYGVGEKPSFINVVNEVYVGHNAHLEHYKIQREAGDVTHNNYTQIFQESNTQINHVTLTLDGMMVRNNLHFYMNGENCSSVLYGLYMPNGTQHVDNHTRVDHAKPNCFSDEKYKGIMQDKSTAVFNGKIMVHLDAQKTNAYQRNQNILLSDEATVNTKPQLEIFADDVKCTHGATIGQLDEEPMFYLRSRGIPENEARKILLNAFADDIAEKIKIPELVALLEQQIDAKL